MAISRIRNNTRSRRPVAHGCIVIGGLLLWGACGETSTEPGAGGTGGAYPYAGAAGYAGTGGLEAGSGASYAGAGTAGTDAPLAGSGEAGGSAGAGTGGAGGIGATGGGETGGTDGTPPTGGAGAAGGSAGDGGTGGTPPTGGAGAAGGSAGDGGTGGTSGTGGAGASGGTGGVGAGTGDCCSDGDCLCHGPDPTGVTSDDGPYDTEYYDISGVGRVYYPTDAEPPLAGVAVCGGLYNTGPEMRPWGPFYASWGIVTVVTSTGSSDSPSERAEKLLNAIEALRDENDDSSSPLEGKLSDRFGTSGYSLGGAGTVIASKDDTSLRSSVGLAAYNPNGNNVQVPTLLLCGASDSTARCSQSISAYGDIPSSTPKMLLGISSATHFNWFDPASAGSGTSGAYALAFQKVFLEGDERWKPYLLDEPGTATEWSTNIQ